MPETNATAAPAAIQVIDPAIAIVLADGTPLTGRLEHFTVAKSLVLFEDGSLTPLMLTVPASDAPDLHAALGPDQVLLSNWTTTRGVPEALADQGIVELTGDEVAVGMFRLQAFVARVL